MKNLHGEKARVAACHAGLECGILGQNYPSMDMVSFGPTILGAHSPDERASISSTQKFWNFLKEILKNIPTKISAYSDRSIQKFNHQYKYLNSLKIQYFIHF